MKKSATLLTCLILFSSLVGHAQKSWQQISQPGIYLNIVDESVSYYFYNEKVGSHGSKYVLNKSTDGGHTYSMIKTKTGDMGCYSMEEMFFIDANTGFFSEVCQGIASIYTTTDGGSTWTSTGMGGSYGISMFFLRQNYGYYSFYPGFPNDSYLMRNGVQAFITKKYVFAHNNYQYPGQKTEIFFRNDSTGLIMCRDSLNNQMIIETENYGNNWTEQLTVGGAYFSDMHFVNDSVGFVVGTYGFLMKTVNFGTQWTTIGTNTSEDIKSIDFAEDGVGYMVGSSGKILKSTDQGDSWIPINFLNSSDLIYVRVFDHDNVYVLDENGKLYSNQNGSTLDEPWMEQLNIFPNPASSELNISIPDEYNKIGISIYDMQGRILITSANENIDLSSIPQGIYIIEIENERGNLRERFIKR